MFPESKYNPIRNKTALVVDDDTAILKLWRDLLLMHDCIVVTRNSGGSAINYLLKHEVDFIITDFNMPGMDGCELIRWVRKNYDLFIPVILCSGSAPETLQPLCDPFTKFLKKPFRIDDLIASISSFETILIKNNLKTRAMCYGK